MDEGELVKLCILGAGSVRCSPAVIGSLATYFGERPLEVRFWDADAERLDLFDRFARLCFTFNKCDHRLLSTDDPGEALSEAGRVLVTVGANCARKLLKVDGMDANELLSSAVKELAQDIEPDAEVLSLIEVGAVLGWPYLDWPPAPSESERRALPHSLLRFLHGDEYLHEFLRTYAASPLKDWLNDEQSVR